MARQGCAPGRVDRHAEDLREIAAELGAAGGSVWSATLDIADADSVEAAVAVIEATPGPIDYLANVAGVLCTGTLLDCGDGDWARTLAVNATGTFNASRALGRRVAERYVVSVSSSSVVRTAQNSPFKLARLT